MKHFRLVALFAVLIFGLALAGCKSSGAGKSTTADSETSGEEATAAPSAGGQDADASADLANPLNQLERTPVYGVYVGMTQTGFCGPTTNSGWFSQFDFDASFKDVRFIEAGPGNPYPDTAFYPPGAVMPMQAVHGEGKVDSYSICPDYDGVENPNSITLGPLPFKPVLRTMVEAELALSPIVGDDAGPQITFQFDMGSAEPDGSIMEWESRIGKGVLGAPSDRFSYVFTVSWKKLMAGEEFEVTGEYQDEGQVQQWTLRFVPQ